MMDISDVRLVSKEEYNKLIADSLELEKAKREKSVSYKRHIAKAISYRMLGTLQTCLISYFFTGNFWVAGSIGLTEICLKPIIYFFHERMWYTFSEYGITEKQTKKD
jgi:uncharacterized membrane protein